MRPAIGYVRVSTAGQVDGLSLDVQRQQITAYATQHALDLELIEDAGLSGRREDRPGWREAIRRCEAGEVDVLVVASLSRCARSARQALDLTDRLDSYGVTFVSLKEQIDLSTTMGRFLRTILAGVAELELEQTRERTIDGKLEALRTRQGWWPGGGTPPTGWRTREGGWLEIDPDGQQALALIRDGYLKGWSSGRVTEALNDAGLSTSRGGPWSPVTVRRVAVNEANHTGRVMYGVAQDDTVRGRFRSSKTGLDGGPIEIELPGEPPWTKAEYQAVVEAVSQRRKQSNQRAGGKTLHPLSGRLISPCGRPMHGVDLSRSSHSSGRRVYRCPGKRLPSDQRCACSQIRAEEVEAIVIERLTVALFDPDTFAEKITSWFDLLQQEAGDDRLGDLERQRDAVKARLNKAIDIALDTDSPAVRRKIVDLESRLDQVEDEIATIEAIVTDIDASRARWWTRLQQTRVEPLTDEQALAEAVQAYDITVRVARAHRGHAQEIDIRGALAENTAEQSSSPRRPSAGSWPRSSPPARCASS
nr:recombinase family protein [Kocuria rosea]